MNGESDPSPSGIVCVELKPFLLECCFVHGLFFWNIMILKVLASSALSSCLELHLLLEVLHNTIKVIDLSLLVLILFIYLIG